MKHVRIAVLTLAVFCLVFSSVFAAGQPSAKATCKVADLTLINWVDDQGSAVGQWVTLLSNTIKTANKNDLFIDVSLECGLFTRTLVRSKNKVKDTSSSDAMIKVKVEVGGVEAEPGPVVFTKRMQVLSATLEGIIGDALYIDDGDIKIDESLVLPEEIELILETMAAHSFNFVLDDVPSGVHTVTVKAMIDFPADNNTYEAGETEAKAMIGKGSMTVESVRLIKDEDIVLE